MFGVAKDPIGFAGGLTSLYDYVGGDPVNFVDETGKAKKKKPNMRENRNKRKGSDKRKKTNARDRNLGHPDSEEHSRKLKGGPKIFKFPIPFVCPACDIQQRTLELLEELENPPEAKIEPLPSDKPDVCF